MKPSPYSEYLSLLHLKGISMISPGFRMPVSASNAFMSTARCCPWWNGSPKGWPNGHLRKMVLGGLTASLYFLTIEMPIVGMPARSISRWISPTD